MIKVDDIVVLKDMEEINFKSIEEQYRYIKAVDCKYISMCVEYRVYLKLSRPLNSGGYYKYYKIGLIDTSNNKKIQLFPMTWFRESTLHNRIKRNSKIDTILK